MNKYFNSAPSLLGKTRLDYAIAPQDCVGTCLLIVRTDSTAENPKVGVPLLDHHKAYIRDVDVLNFIYSTKDNSGQKLKVLYEKNQAVWKRGSESKTFGPIFNRLESE
ncbi:hypothetical protein [Lonepinella sp. BR2357]|uniref:hypothetical protein n=1 Tax=Lonepinella sp. BR2357 TaxID=3434549 RepID=UPI003F6E4178